MIGSIVHFFPKQEIPGALEEKAQKDKFREKYSKHSRAEPENNPEDRDDPLAAIIVGVWSDNEVNLCVFGSTGTPFSATHVPLFADDSQDNPENDPDALDENDPKVRDPKDLSPTARPQGYYAQWMPKDFKPRLSSPDTDVRGAKAELQGMTTIAEDKHKAQQEIEQDKHEQNSTSEDQGGFQPSEPNDDELNNQAESDLATFGDDPNNPDKKNNKKNKKG